MPLRLIVLMPLADTVRVTHRRSEGIQNRCFWMLGSHRRRVLRWLWEMVLPKLGFRPVF